MKLKSSVNTTGWLLAILFSLSVTFTHHSYAEESNFDIFRYHDPNSKVTINYENLTSLLKATVVRARMSSRAYAQRPKPGQGTKINFTNPNPTRLEGSRVLYSFLQDEDLEYIHNLRLAMEALPEAVEFRTLNRNEQLAYWLNLYNLTLYEQIAIHYPVRKLKKLRRGSPSLWNKKILNIYGIALSLNDIQYKIIHKIWPDPLVIYGMYHGSIGGPNIANKAYTGRNVYNLLEHNAEEFINSLRGLRFRGKDALVSEMYQWNREYFPDFQTDLRRHLRKYTNYMLTMRLDTSKTIKTTSYDWYITDVINASVAMAGGHISTGPAALINQNGSKDLPHTGKAWDTAVINLRTRNNSAAFLLEFLKYNNKNVKTKITIEEVEKKDLKKNK